jgi:hypothetical protein
MKVCEYCNKNYTPNSNHQKYCSECKHIAIREKNREREREWQRRQRGKYKKGKIQCQICGKWYRQLGTHVSSIHKIRAREYREMFGLDVKTGKSTLSEDLRKLYGEQAKENGTFKNLKAGEKYWFKPNDRMAGRYTRSKETIERLMTANNRKKGQPRYILTKKDVLKIRELYKTRLYSIRDLGKKYNVSPSTISCAVRGKSWGKILNN